MALFSGQNLAWLFGIFGLVIAGLCLLLEMPFVTRSCPTRGAVGKFVAFFESCLFRTILYLGFAIWMFVSVSFYSLLVIPGLALLLTSGFYGFSVFKGQELHRSFFTGGRGVATVAQAAAGGV